MIRLARTWGLPNALDVGLGGLAARATHGGASRAIRFRRRASSERAPKQEGPIGSTFPVRLLPDEIRRQASATEWFAGIGVFPMKAGVCLTDVKMATT